MSCKLTVQELLKYSSRKIYSKITKILMMNKFSYCLIDQFIGAEFFKKYILPKSWFHLLKEDFLNEENIRTKILNIKYKEELPFNRSDL